MTNEEISNSYLLDEIRENRTEIRQTRSELSGKVGRSELLGWLAMTGLLSGFIVRFGA